MGYCLARKYLEYKLKVYVMRIKPLKMVGHTLISSNERVSVRESVQMWMLLAFLFDIYM